MLRFSKTVVYTLVLGVLILYWPTMILAQTGSANSAQPFPEIVSLQQVLDMAAQNHPDLLLGEADRLLKQAESEALEAQSSGQLYLTLDGRRVKYVSDLYAVSLDDNRAELIYTKPMTDFGRWRLLKQASAKDLLSTDSYLEYLKLQQRINLMQHYFDVILADYRYSVADEAMTVSFFPYDRALERQQKYGEFSDLQVKQRETVFRRHLANRAQAQQRQRATRLRLALALNQPDAKPDQLEYPLLDRYQRELPEFEQILATALQRSPLLRTAKQRVAARRDRVEAAHVYNRPSLSISLEAREYETTTSKHDRLRSSLKYKLPLVGVKRKQAGILLAQGELLQQEAQLKALESSIREQVLELVQLLGYLHSESEAAKVEEEYRELDLDRARLLYEMEVQVQLGSAGTKMAEAIWNNARIEFERAIVWEKLDALVGNEPVRFNQ